ncbi:MAG: hypothetical protein IJB70_05115 [Clostridia bacterium]|nr:hypothetical protein [Clostridia bacterium]
MNPLSLIVMVLLSSISLLLIRGLAPFRENSKLKYISLNSKFWVRCLIPKRNEYVKVNDRNRISIFSLIFYLLFAILVLALISMFILPDIPCEEYVARFGKRGQIKWVVDTLNEKLINLLPILFCLSELIAYFLTEIHIMMKRKTKTKESLCGMVLICLLFIVLFVVFAFQLF